MPVKTRVSLRELQRFIRHGLKRKLQKDLRKLKIVKEADLECCSYYHLRRFIRRDDRWQVLARKYAKKTGRYTDLLIFRKHVPQIAIELKWRRTKISRKDRRALGASLKQLKVNKAYFFSALPDRSKYQKLRKRPNEKYVLHECVVGLRLPREQVERFEAERKSYTRDMRTGKARH